MDNVLKYDNTPEMYLRVTDTKIDEGDDIGAIGALWQGLERHRNDPELLRELAECYCDLELPAYALNIWYRFLAVCPKRDYGAAYNGLGRCYYSLEDDVSAEYCFGQQILYTKDFSDLAEDDAFLYYFGDKGEPSADKYYVAHPAADWQVNDFLAEARAAAAKKDYGAAEELLAKIPYESEDYPEALNLRAMCASAKGDDDRARRILEELVDDEPENLRGWFSLANLHAVRGDYERATDCFDRLLELRPYDVTYLFFAAITAFNAGRIEESEELLADECALAPDESVGMYYLAAVRDYIAHPEKPRPPFRYQPDVPSEERVRRLGILAELASMKKKQLSAFLKSRENVNILRWGFSLENLDFGAYLAAVLAASGLGEGLEILEELLLKTGVPSELKCEILRLICFTERARHVSAVFGFIFKKLRLWKFEIDEKETIVFRLAYSRSFGMLAYVLEEGDAFGEKLRQVAYDLYYRMQERGLLKYLDDEKALACVLQLKCAFKGISRSIQETARIYGADKAKVKEYLELQKQED